MVNALIKIDENTNRVLSILKAKFNLKDKGEAIEFVVSKYIESENDPELLPEFVKKINLIENQRSFKVDDFALRYGIK